MTRMSLGVVTSLSPFNNSNILHHEEEISNMKIFKISMVPFLKCS